MPDQVDSPPEAAATIPDRANGLRVVLVSPRNPLNIGAVARAMSNFGFFDLRLVQPYDLAFREARSAVRSQYVLENAQVFDTTAAAIADCTLVVGSTALGNRDLPVSLHRLETASSLIQEHLQSAPVAILFGSERFGLANEDISHCHWMFRIPTRSEHGAMNLGQAVAVTLYELCRSESFAALRYAAPETAAAEQTERFTAMLIEVMERSGYLKDRTASSTELKTRRLVRRLGIPASDAQTWIGIMRQVLWKLKRDPPG